MWQTTSTLKKVESTFSFTLWKGIEVSSFIRAFFFFSPVTKWNSQNQDPKVMCFSLTNSTNESNAVIAVWDSGLVGTASFWAIPLLWRGKRASAACFGSSLYPQLLTRLLAHRKLWVNLCWKSVHSSEGSLGVLGLGKRINLYWTPTEHQYCAKFCGDKGRFRTAIKFAGLSYKINMQGTCTLFRN